jgi:hypothetical protein
MLIGGVYIVDEYLRIVDVDGESHVDLNADDAIDLLAELQRKKGQLLMILAQQEARMRKSHVEKAVHHE